MSDIRIRREHTLGMDRVRKVAVRWAARAEEKYELQCTRVEGDAGDTIDFVRSGVKGRMRVTATLLEVDVKLGLLLSPFKGAIEAEATKQLDEALAKEAEKTLP